MRSISRSARCLLALVLASCSTGAPESPPATRLVDVFDAARVAQPQPVEEAPPGTLWDFSLGSGGGREDGNWEVVEGVGGLAVRDGALVGRSTSERALLHLERSSGTGPSDLLHAVEIRMRASAGANLALLFDGSESPDVERVKGMIGLFPWSATPIVTGDEVTTYTLTGPFPATSAGTRHIFLRPVDASGADFAIESIRLVFQREHLAGFPTGVSWQGLGEIYHETLVARSPEALQFELDVPPRAFLYVSLGTPQDEPVTFHVEVDGAPTFTRTLTTGGRWESVLVELGDFAGRRVELGLRLDAENAGTIGFWGAPAVRHRGARPLTTAEVAPGGQAEPPQGVILIMLDTLRRDHLELYGYSRQTAPHLTSLAASGVMFSDAIAQATWTKASTPSILTSLHPSSHGVLEFPSRLPSSARTMAEIFRDAGYATINFSSVLFTGKFTNLHQGFETVHESTSVGEEISAKTARVYTDRLLPWLERHRDVPFFAFFHLFDPHDPYEPKPPHNSRWFDPAERDEHHHDEEAVRAVIDDPLRRAFLMPNEAELREAGVDAEAFTRRNVAWYDGSIRGFDAELGRLLERLDELGLADDTLLVFVSDHGEEFLEHGKTFHGHTVYGELVNVPLLMSWPGVLPEGERVEATVRTIDILPTLLELTRLDGPDSMQGQSLLPLFLPAPDQRFRPQPAISEQAAISDAGGNPPPFGKGSISIVWEGWKLIHNHTGRGELPEYELYDHRTDPFDTEDVAAEHPEVVEKLARLLETARSNALEARLESDDEASEGLDPKELERLRALGYVQ